MFSLFKRSDIEKEYSKNDRKALDDLSKNLFDDIDKYITKIDRSINDIESLVSDVGGRNKLDDFMVTKIDEAINNLTKYKASLVDIKRKSKIKLKYMSEIYSNFSKITLYLDAIKDYRYRLKEYIRNEKD